MGIIFWDFFLGNGCSSEKVRGTPLSLCNTSASTKSNNLEFESFKYILYTHNFGNFFFQELKTTTLQPYVVSLLVWSLYLISLISHIFGGLHLLWLCLRIQLTHFTPYIPILFLFSYFCLHNPEHLLFLPVPTSKEKQSGKIKVKTKQKSNSFLALLSLFPFLLLSPHTFYLSGGGSIGLASSVVGHCLGCRASWLERKSGVGVVSRKVMMLYVGRSFFSVERREKFRVERREANISGVERCGPTPITPPSTNWKRRTGKYLSVCLSVFMYVCVYVCPSMLVVQLHVKSVG